MRLSNSDSGSAFSSSGVGGVRASGVGGVRASALLTTEYSVFEYLKLGGGGEASSLKASMKSKKATSQSKGASSATKASPASPPAVSSNSKSPAFSQSHNSNHSQSVSPRHANGRPNGIEPKKTLRGERKFVRQHTGRRIDIPAAVDSSKPDSSKPKPDSATSNGDFGGVQNGKGNKRKLRKKGGMVPKPPSTPKPRGRKETTTSMQNGAEEKPKTSAQQPLSPVGGEQPWRRPLGPLPGQVDENGKPYVRKSMRRMYDNKSYVSAKNRYLQVRHCMLVSCTAMSVTCVVCMYM